MNPSPADTSGANSHDLVRLYAGVVRTLESTTDQDKLSDMLSAIRSVGGDTSMLAPDDTDLQRMLTRIGVVTASSGTTIAAKLTEEFLRECANAVGRSAVHVNVIFRVYSSGLYGVLPKAICGATPLCKSCGITKECDYYNAPPKNPTTKPLPAAKRLALDGPDSLSDEELISVILGGARINTTHQNLSKDLLKRFGSLRGLASASYGELVSLRGISETVAARIACISALQQRVLAERRANGPAVRCGKDFYDLYAPALRDLKKETFLVILLDQKNRIMRDVRVSEGTLTASLVHPREAFGPAIRESAAAVAFVHNHPSGDPAPSGDDINLTKRLKATADTVGIRVLDHVIIGEGRYTSFIDEGLL